MPDKKTKRILLAYRRGIPLVEEPDMQSALKRVEGDPASREWLSLQGDWQDRVCRELRQIPPPSGLRERILSGRARKTPIWRRTWVAAAAAAIALLLAFVSLMAPPPGDEQTFQGFRSRMVKFAEREYRMDLATNDLAVIRGFLRTQKAPADFELTPVLQKTAPIGCGRLAWQGHPVAMVCFALNKTDALYLFVIGQGDIRDGTSLPTPAQPQLEKDRRFAVASWNQGNNIYLLTAPLSVDQLSGYLK